MDEAERAAEREMFDRLPLDIKKIVWEMEVTLDSRDIFQLLWTVPRPVVKQELLRLSHETYLQYNPGVENYL